MIPVAAKAELHQYVLAFTEQGYAHFRGVYGTAHAATLRELYERAVADWQFTNGSQERPDAIGGFLERFPRDVFPAVTHPMLLGFAEAVMGPFVQLDSEAFRVTGCDCV